MKLKGKPAIDEGEQNGHTVKKRRVAFGPFEEIRLPFSRFPTHNRQNVKKASKVQLAHSSRYIPPISVDMLFIPNRTFLVRFGGISGEFGRAMLRISLARRSRAKIRRSVPKRYGTITLLESDHDIAEYQVNNLIS